MKYFIWLILIQLTWLGSACNQGNIDLDNAGEEDLVLFVDEFAHDMPAGAYKQLQLDPGTHRLVVKNKEGRTLEESTITVQEGGLINLGKANYLVWTDLYGNPELRKTKLQEDWIDIGKQSFFGEFEKLDPGQLYMEQTWEYGLDDDFPDDLMGWEMTQEKWIIKRKLFREDDLVEAYHTLSEQKQ